MESRAVSWSERVQGRWAVPRSSRSFERSPASPGRLSCLSSPLSLPPSPRLTPPFSPFRCLPLCCLPLPLPLAHCAPSGAAEALRCPEPSLWPSLGFLALLDSSRDPSGVAARRWLLREAVRPEPLDGCRRALPGWMGWAGGAPWEPVGLREACRGHRLPPRECERWARSSARSLRPGSPSWRLSAHRSGRRASALADLRALGGSEEAPQCSSVSPIPRPCEVQQAQAPAPGPRWGCMRGACSLSPACPRVTAALLPLPCSALLAPVCSEAAPALRRSARDLCSLLQHADSLVGACRIWFP